MLSEQRACSVVQMAPLLAQSVRGTTSGNVSVCMNRVLPYKRIGLLQELLWDDQKAIGPPADMPDCVAVEHALGYGSMLKPVRKRARKWKACLECGQEPTKHPADFRSDGEQMNNAIESASLEQLQAQLQAPHDRTDIW